MSDCNCVGGFSNNCPVHAGNQERNPVAVERVTLIGYLEEIESLQAQNERLVKALGELVEAATVEVNEKGAGGYLLARITDAKAVLGEVKK